MHLAEELKEVPCALTASRAQGDPPAGQLGPGHRRSNSKSRSAQGLRLESGCLLMI